VSLTVRISGNTGLSGDPVSIFISTDPIKSADDYFVESGTAYASGSASSVTIEFPQPDYSCHPNGLFFIAYTDSFNLMEPREQAFLFFDSATEDLKFRHTWNENGGICDYQGPWRRMTTRVGGWIRNDDGCEATEPSVISPFIRNLATGQITRLQLDPRSGTNQIPSIPAGGRRYFNFSVKISSFQPMGSYEMCFEAQNRNPLRELDVSNNIACKSFFLNHLLPCENMLNSPEADITNKASFFTAGPNPTRDLVTVNYSPEEGSTASFSLADINGRVISTTTVGTKEQTGKFQYDLSNQVNGIYFIRLQFDNGEPPLVKRIVKQ